MRIRNSDILRIFRRLPPKVQLGVGAVAIVAIGALWFTGNLPDELEQGRSFTSAETHRQTGARAPQRETEAASAKPRPARTSDAPFDYYVLALSWSPTYCEDAGRKRGGQQCSGPRPYAFVLHGLWPQFRKGWPENCGKGRAWVPKQTISRMLDIMPSRGLIIHEYKKHGTCSGLDADGYFALSRDLYNKVRIPPVFIRPERALSMSPQDIEKAFLRANPRMNASMLAVACGRKSRLKEVRVCFSKDGKLASCGINETQRRLCSRNNLRIPPVRPGRRS
ncbi:MAG: ribonuclease T2 [Pseudomonadota bacterium]